ncbi:hypothetical protein CONPUDRAFT_143137 [Coniophora puteana RWD-64-598 SS2]|uniref:Uncharacterized protein n=1 Tax=Coniophora puteana (strain RWD-64-598) TaxID=741705 RepID=A0A5M3MWQ2_CONPW|nr:uncharacterized protein CONPUDRAFT_143137 [Coniophora puteana RWD-64-598 SS2]EIW83135.1 hypothetical protein CONPUDRAFT_143137 [Coniophora puteana RWD-64-598 SS2]
MTSDSSEASSECGSVPSSSTSLQSSETPPPSPTKPRRPPPVPRRLDSIGDDPSLLVGKVLTRLSRSANHPVLTLDFADDTSFQILVDGYDPMHPGLPKSLEMDAALQALLDTAGTSGQARVNFTVKACALITLTDKAFHSDRSATVRPAGKSEQRWDQNHTGVALRFAEDGGGWHCVWATLADYEDQSDVSNRTQSKGTKEEKASSKPKDSKDEESSPFKGRDRKNSQNPAPKPRDRKISEPSLSRPATCVFRSYDDVYIRKLIRTPHTPRKQHKPKQRTIGSLEDITK